MNYNKSTITVIPILTISYANIKCGQQSGGTEASKTTKIPRSVVTGLRAFYTLIFLFISALYK